MHVVEVTVPTGPDLSQTCNALQSLLGALRMNGQVLGREWPIAQTSGGLRATVMVPEAGSLGGGHHNRYAREAWRKLASVAGAEPLISVVGQDPSGAAPDRCKRPSCYILFTTYIDLESPLRCGDCFLPVALYRIRPTRDEEYHNIICWQSDYQACDRLQMNCATGERFGTRELSRVDSSLSRRGLDVCGWVADLTGVPTYYYLYCALGRTWRSEERRRCPACGRPWLLKDPWHRRFDFRCDRCRLVSNLAWDVR